MKKRGFLPALQGDLLVLTIARDYGMIWASN
jgi:hypothetical protein